MCLIPSLIVRFEAPMTFIYCVSSINSQEKYWSYFELQYVKLYYCLFFICLQLEQRLKCNWIFLRNTLVLITDPIEKLDIYFSLPTLNPSISCVLFLLKRSLILLLTWHFSLQPWAKESASNLDVVCLQHLIEKLNTMY